MSESAHGGGDVDRVHARRRDIGDFIDAAGHGEEGHFQLTGHDEFLDVAAEDGFGGHIPVVVLHSVAVEASIAGHVEVELAVAVDIVHGVDGGKAAVGARGLGVGNFLDAEVVGVETEDTLAEDRHAAVRAADLELVVAGADKDGVVRARTLHHGTHRQYILHVVVVGVGHEMPCSQIGAAHGIHASHIVDVLDACKVVGLHIDTARIGTCNDSCVTGIALVEHEAGHLSANVGRSDFVEPVLGVDRASNQSQKAYKQA